MQNLCTVLALALLACCVRPAKAQYVATLLSGGTNSVDTNGVFYPARTVRISFGAYTTVGLWTEARTVAAATTNNFSVGWIRSIDGTRWESNVWLVTTAPLLSASTNGFLTNLTVGPWWGMSPLWLSNQNVNAYATNCLTNIQVLYFLR